MTKTKGVPCREPRLKSIKVVILGLDPRIQTRGSTL
jgi:hypothetical protein